MCSNRFTIHYRYSAYTHTYKDINTQQYSKSVPTHDRGKAESKAQSQGYLAGHAAPVLRLSEEDD